MTVGSLLGRASAALVPASTAGRVVLLALLLVDVALIGANLIFHTVDEPEREPVHPVWSDLRWNGDNDGSWMEHAGQVQLLGAVGGLLVLLRRTSAPLYGALASLLTFLVVDDVLQIHEAGGVLAVRSGVPSVLGVPAQQLGELAVWAVAGAVLLPLLALAWRRSPRRARRDGLVVVALFAVFLVFAAGVDTLRPAIYDVASSWVETGLSLSESAGELVVLTLMAGAVVVMLERTRPASPAGPEVAA